MAKSTPETFDPTPEKAAPKPAEAQIAQSAEVHTTYPGQTLGIVALVLAFFLPIPALTMGIIAWVWSHKAGKNNVLAKVSVFVAGAFTLIGVFLLGLWVALAASLSGGLYGGWLPGDHVYMQNSGNGMIMPGEMSHLDDMMRDFDQDGGMKHMLPAPSELPQLDAPQSN